MAKVAKFRQIWSHWLQEIHGSFPHRRQKKIKTQVAQRSRKTQLQMIVENATFAATFFFVSIYILH